jgi:hypothetical protein
VKDRIGFGSLEGGIIQTMDEGGEKSGVHFGQQGNVRAATT